MWNRAQLKRQGKAAFKANYWNCVLIALVMFAVTGGIGALTGGFGSVEAAEDPGWWVLFSGAAVAVSLAGSLAYTVLWNPLEVGCRFFFRENLTHQPEIYEMGRCIRGSYIRIVCTMFLKDLFVLLWTLLLIVPGLISYYSYRMVPFILGDNPELGLLDVLRLSRNMMKGHKWRAFVLDLSFLGWSILGFLTLGLVWIFYTGPYMNSTDAALYEAVKAEYAQRTS